MRWLALALLGAPFLLWGCSPAPLPTATPYPTYTPYPTNTPYPTPTPALAPAPTAAPTPTPPAAPGPTAKAIQVAVDNLTRVTSLIEESGGSQRSITPNRGNYAVLTLTIANPDAASKVVGDADLLLEDAAGNSYRPVMDKVFFPGKEEAPAYFTGAVRIAASSTKRMRVVYDIPNAASGLRLMVQVRPGEWSLSAL